MEDASLTTKGVVKLSSAVDSTSESLAATPKAVKTVKDSSVQKTGDTMGGQLKIGTINALRIFNQAFGLIFRRSEDYIHLIPTNEGEGENGDIGSLRPFSINLRSGLVSIGNGLKVGGSVTGKLTGNADTATKIKTARKIGGVAFDGSADINLPGVNATGNQNTTGNAATATKLQAARTINGVSFDGSANITLTPSNIGALALTGGTLSGGLTAAGEIISKSANGLRIAYGNYGFFIRNDGSNTYFMLTDSGNSLGTYNSLRPFIISNSTGNVTIATKLNASSGITGSLSGNASTATKLQTARTIGGVSFDGTANINLPGVNAAGNQNTTGNAATATKLQTARTINGVSFNGSANISIPTITSRGRVTALTGTTQGAATGLQMYEAYNNGYPSSYGNVLHLKGATAVGEGELFIGWSGTSGAHAPVHVRSRRDTDTSSWSEWAQVYTSKDSIPGVNATGNQNTTGNAASATKLQTARTIGGVAFDGSADITLTAANLNAYTKTEVTNLLSSYVKSSSLPSMTVRTSSVSGGDMGMSLSTFISHLKSNGAFSKSYWIGFGDAMGFNAGSINNITGFGAVELAESIIEVFNLPNGDYTIRLTTSHKADYGGVTNAILVYHYRSNRSPSGQWLKFAGTVGATSN
ncbi:TPA: tail fiber protein [Escherichia coli]|nr:tail fiber protein [Escherichia coli]HBB9830602.1 tail fiber protein [Escherichia coli]HBB9835515.1 tail fiber protein [Escherichia coli]